MGPVIGKRWNGSVNRDNVILPQHVGSVDRESIHWKEQSNNATATARNMGEYVCGPCVQGVFTHCLAYDTTFKHSIC